VVPTSCLGPDYHAGEGIQRDDRLETGPTVLPSTRGRESIPQVQRTWATRLAFTSTGGAYGAGRGAADSTTAVTARLTMSSTVLP
jgi:hypothetical protein